MKFKAPLLINIGLTSESGTQKYAIKASRLEHLNQL